MENLKVKLLRIKNQEEENTFDYFIKDQNRYTDRENLKSLKEQSHGENYLRKVTTHYYIPTFF